MIQNKKSILVETVNKFGRQEWFRDASVHDNHLITGEPTLEIKVNYVPIFERKSVLEFAQKYTLTLRFVVVDKAGNPVD